jgi:hypothetical protein
MKEENALQTRPSSHRAGGSAPRGASRLKVRRTGEEDTPLHDMLGDKSVQATRSGGAENGEES